MEKVVATHQPNPGGGGGAGGGSPLFIPGRYRYQPSPWCPWRGFVAGRDDSLDHLYAGAGDCAYGTALAVIRAAVQEGKRIQVVACETRPLLQGARLTTWELMKDGIPVTLITDNMAGYLMQQGRIQAVLTGADRIAANGDVANKIGTYSLAVLAQAHGIPFYVAAPMSTFDLTLPDGQGIPIEERAAEEVTWLRGQRIAPTE